MLFFNRVPARFLDAGASTGGEAKTEPGAQSKEGGQTPPPASASEQGSSKADEEELDLAKLDPKVQTYIKNLRKENGKHRTKANALEAMTEAQKVEFSSIKKRLAKLSGEDVEDDDDVPLEARFQTAQANVNGLMVQNSILETALVHGIPQDSIKYFQYCMAEAVSNLEEGEELEEDAIKAIVAEVKSKSKSSSGAQTSPTGKATGQAPVASTSKGNVSIDQFVAMGLMEKGKLFEKDPELYKALATEAKAKKLFK